MPFNTQPPYNLGIVEDVTVSRALGVNYTNNTGRTMFVFVSVRCTTGAAPNMAYAASQINSSDISYAGYESGVPAGLNTNFTLPFAVPPGGVYSVGASVSGTGAVFLRRWIEAY